MYTFAAVSASAEVDLTVPTTSKSVPPTSIVSPTASSALVA
jgi:hypothetical protein